MIKGRKENITVQVNLQKYWPGLCPNEPYPSLDVMMNLWIKVLQLSNNLIISFPKPDRNGNELTRFWHIREETEKKKVLRALLQKKREAGLQDTSWDLQVWGSLHTAWVSQKPADVNERGGADISFLYYLPFLVPTSLCMWKRYWPPQRDLVIHSGRNLPQSLLSQGD